MTPRDTAELAALIADQEADRNDENGPYFPSKTEYEWFRDRNYKAIGNGAYIKESCVGAE